MFCGNSTNVSIVPPPLLLTTNLLNCCCMSVTSCFFRVVFSPQYSLFILSCIKLFMRFVAVVAVAASTYAILGNAQRVTLAKRFISGAPFDDFDS